MQVCCVSLLAAGISDVHTDRKTDPRPFTPTSPLYVDNRCYVKLVHSNFNRANADHFEWKSQGYTFPVNGS
jgi:hypothetical protein